MKWTQHGPEGFGVDMLNEIGRLENLKVHYTDLAFARCVSSLRDDVVDVIAFSDLDETMSDLIVIEKGIVTWTLSAVVHAASAYRAFDGLEMFAGQSVGLVSSYVYPDEIRSFGWQRVESANQTILNLRKVAGRRITVTFDEPPFVLRTMEQERLPLRILEPPVSTAPQGLILKDQTLAERLSRRITELQRDGTIGQLYHNYGLPPRS